MQWKPDRRFYRILWLLLISAFVTGCSHSEPMLPHQIPDHAFAIKNVNLISMKPGAEPLSGATVVIQGDSIASVNGQIPRGAKVIDGRGKWLIPGLIDMHVHVPTDGHFNTTFPTHAAVIFASTQDVMTPFVANGVTTIFDLGAKAGHFGQRNEILRGDVVGPRMALAGMINGGDEAGRTVNTPSDGRQAVRSAKAEGYDYIKVYSQLNMETFAAIIDEAAKQQMKVVGHIPNAFRGSVEKALIPHFGMVAHAEEFAKQSSDYSDEDAQRFAKLAKDNGVWLSPTLTVLERIAAQARSLDSVRNLPSLQYVHPLLQNKWLTANQYNKGASPAGIQRLEKMIGFNNRLVKAFKEAGVPIVAGTDAGGVVWGFSLHDELVLLVQAGMTPREALNAATYLPALWLGLDTRLGTIEAGKYADLVLLDADPFADISNTRKVAGVFVNGRWLGKRTIDAMLSDLSRRFAASKGQWEWSRRTEY